MTSAKLTRLTSGQPEPKIADTKNLRGVEFVTLTYPKAADADALCVDVFTFETSDGKSQLVSALVVRAVQSRQQALELADMIWRKLYGEDAAARIDVKGLRDEGDMAAIEGASPLGQNASRIVSLSIERQRENSYVVRCHIAAR